MLEERSLYLTIVVFLLLASVKAFDCSTASLDQCGEGICTDYKWSDGVCAPYKLIYCLEGSKWSNQTSSCVPCANLTSGKCSALCSDYYLSIGSGNNNSNTCASCKFKYGQGCSSCNQTSCLSCDSSVNSLVLAADSSHCFHTLCGLPNCQFCSTNATCSICRTGFDLNITGNCA